MDRFDHGRHPDRPLVWLWAVVVAGLMLVPYLRRLGDEWHNWRFTGIVSADFRDTAYHLSWARQARDGSVLFENKFAGAEPRGRRFFNLLFLLMGWTARATGLSVVGVFHIERTAVAILVLVGIYWFAGHFFADRRMRWVGLVLATFSAGFEGLDAVGYWPPVVENLNVRQTVTAWSLEWEVVVGPAMGLLLLSFGLMCKALEGGGRWRLVALAVVGLVHASVYPHDVPTVVGVTAVLVIVRVAAEKRGRTPFFVKSGNRWTGVGALAAYALGAAPVWAYHVSVLTRDPSYWAYTGLYDRFGTGDFPAFYGLILFPAVLGAAAIVWRGERGRLLLVVWPAVVAALLATPYPRTQRVHLFHGLQIVLCLLAVRGLWGVGRFVRARWPGRSAAGARHAAIASLAVLLGLASIVTVAHYAGEMGTWLPKWFTFLREQEMEAVAFLDQAAAPDDVIACLPKWGCALPMWTGSRVYAGHPEITVDYASRAWQMERLMGRKGRLAPATVAAILRSARADYVFVDSEARRMGAEAMEETLLDHRLAEVAFANTWVAIYRVHRDALNGGVLVPPASSRP